MRIEIEIPKEFEEHFKQDKFKDSFERIMADIRHSLENGDCLCAGRYEYETIEMLEKAFENSRQAYSVAKVVEKLEELKTRYFLTIANTGDEKSDFAYENVGNALDKAIEIVKQGGATKNCNNCANYTESDEVDNGCYLCCKGYEDNYESKVDNGGVGKDVE